MGRADRIAKMLRDFTVSELEDLQFFIDEQIDRLREEDAGASNYEEEEEQERTVTVREEYKNCGKAACQCNTEGKLHGPYLYEYWKITFAYPVISKLVLQGPAQESEDYRAVSQRPPSRCSLLPTQPIG